MDTTPSGWRGSGHHTALGRHAGWLPRPVVLHGEPAPCGLTPRPGTVRLLPTQRTQQNPTRERVHLTRSALLHVPWCSDAGCRPLSPFTDPPIRTQNVSGDCLSATKSGDLHRGFVTSRGRSERGRPGSLWGQTRASAQVSSALSSSVMAFAGRCALRACVRGAEHGRLTPAGKRAVPGVQRGATCRAEPARRALNKR